MSEYVPDWKTGAPLDLFMATVTNLGDAGVTIAASALLFACFLGWSRALALQWAAAVGACGLVTAAAKLALYVNATPAAPFLLASPSGHVAASVLVYGVLPVAAAERRRPWVALAVGLVALIAVSRIYLQAHNAWDVLAGGCIGGACLAWFLRGRAGRHAAAPLRFGMPLAVALCVVGAAAGWRLHLDRMLQAVAGYLST